MRFYMTFLVSMSWEAESNMRAKRHRRVSMPLIACIRFSKLAGAVTTWHWHKAESEAMKVVTMMYDGIGI
jgi:hypothetical protein